jgi:hypothetical protein
MRLNNSDLRQIFLSNFEENIPNTRNECPSPKKLLRLFRAKKSEKEKTQIIDHITSCYHCTHEFEFILKALRYEGDMNQVAQNFLETKRKKASPQRLSWRYAPLVVGISVLCVIITISVIPNSYRHLKYRTSVRSQINLFLPHEKNIPKSSLFFQWEDVKDTEYYTFELYDDTLYQIWSSNKISQNNYILLKEISSRLEANKTYFWMVSAFFPSGRKMESQLKEIFLIE